MAHVKDKKNWRTKPWITASKVQTKEKEERKGFLVQSSGLQSEEEKERNVFVQKCS